MSNKFQPTQAVFASRIPAVLCCVILSLVLCSSGVGQTVTTWTGGGDGVNYSDAANWDTGVVPINAGASTFEVIIPSDASVTFDVAGTGNVVSELDLAIDATLEIEFGRDLGVTNFATIAGVVTTDNSTFRGGAVGERRQQSTSCHWRR